jgi:hypothetical protein
MARKSENGAGILLEYYWTTACSLIRAVFSPQFPTLFDAMVTILHTDYRMEILEMERCCDP